MSRGRAAAAATTAAVATVAVVAIDAAVSVMLVGTVIVAVRHCGR